MQPRQTPYSPGTAQDLHRKMESRAIQGPLHVEVAGWGDVLLIAPLSANSMAKFAMGLCDNLVCRTFRCWDTSKPVVVAPAMNTKMWNHAATARHLKELKDFGVLFVDPICKTLACGDVGVGAMASVLDIVDVTLSSCEGTVKG
jgi:phosphopantothenoylcysteine decarboxylase